MLGRRNLWPSLCVAQDRLGFAAAAAIQKAISTFAERKAEEECGHSPGSVLQLPGGAQVCSALLEKDANKRWVAMSPRGLLRFSFIKGRSKKENYKTNFIFLRKFTSHFSILLQALST